MEGINPVNNAMKNSVERTGSAAATTSSYRHGVLQRKDLPKDQVKYVVVSYKESATKGKDKASYVSAMPSHWIDNDTLWYPPTSERPRQVIIKATWRTYFIRRVYWDTLTSDRSQAKADAEVYRAREEAEDGTSTESDVPQQRVKAKVDVVAKQPPSAPTSNKPKQSIDVSTIGKDRKRPRFHAASECETDCEPDVDDAYESLRRSPRKHQSSNILTQMAKAKQGISALEPEMPTAESTSLSQPSITSPARPIENYSLDDVLTTPNAESTPKTAKKSRLEDKMDQLGQTLSRIESRMETLARIESRMESKFQFLADAISDINKRFDNSHLDTSSVANSSVHSTGSVEVLRKRGYDRLTAEQRSILCKTPLVSTDFEHNELDQELKRSGRDGGFFEVLVRSLEDRVTNKSDANKTANGCLRAVYQESYLADRVTMAGYKRCNFTTSNRDYGQPGKRYVALGGSEIYWAIFEAVKLACHSKTTDDKIKKAIRDGVNTLRLHDRDRRMRLSRQQAECSNHDINEINETEQANLLDVENDDDGDSPTSS